jgi:RNA polymerase sigma-70 factor (ECF subfamily)
VTLTDAESLRRFRAGDNDAFRALAKRYHKSVLAYLSRYFNLSHRVADVTQEAFFRLYRLVTLDQNFCLENETLQPLLIRIAGAAAIDAVRHESSLDETHNALAIFSPTNLYRPDNSALVSEIRLDVQRAMAKLPPDLRQIGQLHYLDGHSSVQVAEITGYPQSAIKHRIRRVRQLLVKHLKDYF